jgi:hypothetical protein
MGRALSFRGIWRERPIGLCGLMPFWVPVVVWLVFALGILFRPVLSERIKKIISGKHDSGTQ